jgi:serine/threonine protein kinase
MTPRVPADHGAAAPAPDEHGRGDERTSRVPPPYSVEVEVQAHALETRPGFVHATPAESLVAPRPQPARPPRWLAETDDLIGAQCGGYVIESLIGEGGMGRVYLARHPRMGKRAAVKIIGAEHAHNPRNLDRFFQEAKAAAQIDDPNIVEVVDSAELPGGRAYLLMPFIEGCSLEELCERSGPLPLDVAATILLQICSGLDAADRKSVV